VAPARILFLVNGLGLGNSTRCHAVIQRLLERGAEIQIVTSGSGLWYFSSVPGVARLHEIESLYYGVKDGRISIVRTLAAVADFGAILRRNARRVAAVVDAWRPDVAVADSVYTFRPFRQRSIPFVALSNADVVHVSYRRADDRPRSIRAQFWCVEELDYLFHRTVPDLVISPCLDPTLAQVGGNVHRVGPIVRQGFAATARPSGVKTALVMLSGSRFGSPVRFDRTDWPFDIDVVGRSAPEHWKNGHGRIRFHGMLLDSRALVERADLVVVNGGFSAISESFSLKKPLVVVPVPNHAEQWVNARAIERLGVGMRVQEGELEGMLESAARHAPRFRDAYERLGTLSDGAAQAADLIMAAAARTGAPRG
jgi:UDP:flavonoid glycosyltransferase YjiC (YdhE family)